MMNNHQLLEGHSVLGSVTSYIANETSFKPATYVPTDSVQQQHHFFRFGHTNNIEALISGLQGSNDMATDYILGVTATSMLIFGIALLWFLIVLGFKCAGHKRVGFLAGRLESPAWQPESLSPIEECLTEDDEDVSTQTPTGHQHSASSGPENFSARGNELEQEKKVKKFKRKAFAVRVVFIISGIFVMTAGVLFYTEGVTAFLNSLGDIQNSLHIVESTALESVNLTMSVIESKHKLLSGLNETISETGSGFCQGSGQLATEIREEGQQLVSDIKEMSSAVDASLKSFSTDLMTVANMAKGINNDLQTASGFFYALVAISIVIFVLICIMLAVTVLSAKDISNCFTKCVTCALIWPVFVFLLVLSWIFATLFLVFSLAGSDFCYKPDQIVITVLNQNKDKFDSVIFAFIIYYVSGCDTAPQAMDDITKLITMAKTMLATANDLAGKVASQNVDNLATGCGLDNAGAAALQKGAQVIFEVSQALEKLLGSFKGIISCRNINPIYTSLVYDATCTEAVDGFTWLYGTCFALCICAMIMITFRAALYPVKRPERDQTGLNAPLLSSKNGY
jgi:hypothetical protein